MTFFFFLVMARGFEAKPRRWNKRVLFIMAGDDEALPPPMEEEMEEFVPKLTRKEVDCGHWALLGRG
jgi:pimeloyl-ACP methyl ester carboxylesterase